MPHRKKYVPQDFLLEFYFVAQQLFKALSICCVEICRQERNFLIVMIKHPEEIRENWTRITHIHNVCVRHISHLFSVFFLYSLDKLLGAITTAAERNNRERFSPIVEGLENHEALQLQVS